MKFETSYVLLISSLILSLATCGKLSSTKNHLRSSLTNAFSGSSVMPGQAIDIGSGGEGFGNTLWIAGSDNKISRWNEQLQKWEYMNGAGPRVSVGPDGKAWVIGSDYGVYAYNGNGWTHMGAWGLDIARGARSEDAYVIDMYHRVLKWTGSYNWASVGSIKANKIAVDPFGYPWVIDVNGKVFKYNENGQWEDKQITAIEIFIEQYGTVHIVRPDKTLNHYYDWNGTWLLLPGITGTNLAVDADRNFYILDASGKITKYTR